MQDSFICQQIGKSFTGDGIETHALTDINLTLEAGDFISIIGPSGSGSQPYQLDRDTRPADERNVIVR